jgi:RNA polymerase sigma-19 factor, ECF subfamily
VKAKSPNPKEKLVASAAAHFSLHLHKYFMRRLRRPQDADDLVQELYMRLLRMEHEPLVRKPLQFLYGVASHVLADFRIDSEQEGAHVTIDSDAVERWSESASNVFSEDPAERLHLQQALDRAVAALPPLKAAILILHKRDGLTYEEIATKLNISPITVHKYLTWAKSRVRSQLTQGDRE